MCLLNRGTVMAQTINDAPPEAPGNAEIAKIYELNELLPTKSQRFFNSLIMRSNRLVSNMLANEATLRREFRDKASKAKPYDKFRKALEYYQAARTIYTNLEKLGAFDNVVQEVEKENKKLETLRKTKVAIKNKLKAKSGNEKPISSSNNYIGPVRTPSGKPNLRDQVSNQINKLEQKVKSIDDLYYMSKKDILIYFEDIARSEQTFRKMKPTYADKYWKEHANRPYDAIDYTDITTSPINNALSALLFYLTPTVVSDGEKGGIADRNLLESKLKRHSSYLKIWRNSQKQYGVEQMFEIDEDTGQPTLRAR